jgi:glutamine cyclotransferase
MNRLRDVFLASCFIFPLLFCLSAQDGVLDKAPVIIPYKITSTYPHPPGSFTQGLVFEDGFLYEGTGQYGSSSLRKINLKSGEIMNEVRLPRDIFGEGITIYKDKIIQLTWFSQIGFVYDKKSFQRLDTFRYPISIEGWGITTDGKHLIISDGSNRLYFLDPESFEVKSHLDVYDHLGPVQKVNELEYVRGSIYANIWQQPKIIKIDLGSGRVTGIIDLSEIVPEQFRNHVDNVLNGIAYDSENKRFFVTGKMWPHIFELKLLVSE